MNPLHKSIENIQHLIKESCILHQKNPSDISLIAVSKTHPADTILHALRLSMLHFGENRIQEAQQKWPELKNKFPSVSLHFIGPLQSNKVRIAVQLFDYIHSIDRSSLVHTIAKAQRTLNRRPICLIQVNTGGEIQKAGIAKDQFHDLYQYARQHELNIKGVMSIPPIDADPTRHFNICRQIAEDYALPIRSYGMSNDFSQAIACGATHIRIGTAIFGKRAVNT